MITVLQRFLSRHRRWFFGLLLCIVVVPFVFTIGAMPGIGSGHGGKKRLFFGVNLSSPEAVGELQRATALGLYLEGVEGAFLGTAMMARAAWDWVARCLQVPFPDAAHLENFVRTRPPFLDESGAFSGEHYGEFSQSLRRKSGREESFVAEVLADDWRIHLTAGALAGTDFSLPIEARLQTRQLLTEWTLLKATLRFETFKPAISFSEDDLRSFFTSHSQRYVEPERVQVDSIFFPDSGDVGGGADAFLCKIHGEKTTLNVEEISIIAKKFGGTIRSLEPYAAEELGVGGPFPTEIMRMAFDLSEENPLSGPMATGDGTCVLLFRGRRAAAERPFEVVRDEVERHCHQQKLVELFARHARDIREGLVEQLSSGVPFEGAARSLGLEVGPEQIFTPEKLPKNFLPEQLGVILGLRRGEISEFVLQKPDLHLWYAREKKLPKVDSRGDVFDRITAENSANTGPEFVQQVIEELIFDELRKL